MQAKEKPKNNLVWSLIVFAIMAAIFVGPRVFGSQKLSAETVEQIKIVQEKIGLTGFNELMKPLKVMGYTALCIEEGVTKSSLMQEAQAYNQRNELKMSAITEKVETKYELTFEEKIAIDKYAFYEVKKDIKEGVISCDNVSNRVKSGEWDL